MIFLKYNTASQEILLGPFVDDTDGKTAETGLTIANTDIKIHKAGATTLASKNSGGGTHISNGNYYAVFDATDTDTVGSGAIVVQVSGALAFRVNFCVLPAMIYDSLIGGTDRLDTNVTHIGDTAQTARDIGASVLLSNGTGAGQLKLASGYVAMTWADIAAPTTAVAFTGTTIATTQKVDLETIKTQSVTAAAGVTFPASVASPTNITAGTITTVTNLTNAPTSGDLTAAMKSSVNAEVVDALATDTYAELSAVPAATSTLSAKINWLFALARNKLTQTATTTKLRNDADGADIATSTVSDDGTTATRGEWT